MHAMKRYHGLRRHELVRAISSAIESSGAQIVREADPTVAPFEYRIRLRSGELQDLVCYAFTANRYLQGGRPAQEHRFQIKYGSEFDRYHELYMDPSRARLTLMFGYHHELDLIIAVDPSMHNPTRFSSSVEFKSGDLQQALEVGWHGWERERSEARRRQVMPLDDLRTEAVIALRPEHFLRYVAFERAACGIDPGERLLLSDHIARHLDEGHPALAPATSHPLEALLGLSATEILDVVGGAFRLLAAVRGSVAEHHLGEYLRRVKGVTRVRHIDEDGQPDFEVLYRRRPVLIECKNVLRKPVRGLPRVDFQKTRAAKGNPCSRYYAPSQFDVLAACLHPITERWEFSFCSTLALAPHAKCPGRLSDRVLVGGETWRSDLRELLA